MLLLCYFIVSLDTFLAGGSRHPRETDEFGTVFVFCSRKGCERERVQIRARPGSMRCGFNYQATEPSGFNYRKESCFDSHLLPLFYAS